MQKVRENQEKVNHVFGTDKASVVCLMVEVYDLREIRASFARGFSETQKLVLPRSCCLSEAHTLDICSSELLALRSRPLPVSLALIIVYKSSPSLRQYTAILNYYLPTAPSHVHQLSPTFSLLKDQLLVSNKYRRLSIFGSDPNSRD
jgi:hypothetical protein